MTATFYMLVSLAILMILLGLNLLRVAERIEKIKKDADERLDKLSLGAELWSEAIEHEKARQFDQAQVKLWQIRGLA